MKKQQLIYTKGLPASGKSTWAIEQVTKNKNTVIINRDKIREMLVGVYQNFPFGTYMEDLVTHIEEKAIEKALTAGYDVIVDATNFKITENVLHSLEQVYNVQHSFMGNLEVKLQDFTHIPVEECIKRDRDRFFNGDKSVGQEVIISMYNRYLKNNDKKTD